MKRLLCLLVAGLFLAGCTNPLANINFSKKSGLQVTSIPPATVFLDGNSLGLTPVREENIKPGEHSIKLVPQDPSLQPYETKVKLTPGVLTAIDRTLAANANDAHGFTLSFEPLGNKRDVILDVTTVPDKVTVGVDSTPQGFTPLSLDTVAAGDHVILFSTPGFIEKTVRAKAIAGYRLTMAVQLARAPTPVLAATTDATLSAQLSPTPTLGLSPTPSKTPTPTKIPTPTVIPKATASATPRPYVEILETGTGWLRVRSVPAGEEVAKVNVGETFPYKASSTAPTQGWYQIEYAPAALGWVSSQYAKLVQ